MQNKESNAEATSDSSTEENSKGRDQIQKVKLFMSLIALYVVFYDLINICLNAQGKQSFHISVSDSNNENESFPIISYESQTDVVRLI